MNQKAASLARGMIGTPWVHRGRTPGQALDCVGVVLAVASGLKYDIPDYEYSHPLRASEAELLPAILGIYFDRVEPYETGDVVLVKIKQQFQHLAIYVGGGRMVHADMRLEMITEASLLYKPSRVQAFRWRM